MTSKWLPSLESWGLPHFLNADEYNDIGPAAIGRVFQTESVAVEDALNRVVATAIVAQLPVPSRELAAVSGHAINSGDTLNASPTQAVRLSTAFRLSHLLGSGAKEPVLPSQQKQMVEPFGFVVRGADAVLDTTSQYYKGTLVREKTEQKIIAHVPAGTGVIGAGADFKAGAQLLYEGRRVRPGDIAALCMAGVTEISVFARPRVAVCVINRYFQPLHAAKDTNSLPDGVTPMVLSLLKRWGVEVDAVHRCDFSGREFDRASSPEINAISENYDVTLVLGFLGDSSEMDCISSPLKLRPIAEPHLNTDGEDDSYTRHRGLYRPADISRLIQGGENNQENSRKDRCKLLLLMQGLPLPIYTAMYTVVKPTLDALSGVGAYPVQSGYDFVFGSARCKAHSMEKRRALLSRLENGMSSRHGVLWLTGVLAGPAPRDPERHWLQLAKIVKDGSGHTLLQVLPSEEYEVSGLIAAEAMVGIERGDGELAAGTAVQYFLLD